MLPPISPRSAGPSGFAAAAQPPLQDWTPHDVSEWLYGQARAAPSSALRTAVHLLPPSERARLSAALCAQPAHFLPPSERARLNAASASELPRRSRVCRQATKDDYSHTFLVQGIDGPALLSLTREQLSDWKVKQSDQTIIMKAVQVRDPQPVPPMNVHRPTRPTSASSRRRPRRRRSSSWSTRCSPMPSSAAPSLP